MTAEQREAVRHARDQRAREAIGTSRPSKYERQEPEANGWLPRLKEQRRQSVFLAIFQYEGTLQ